VSCLPLASAGSSPRRRTDLPVHTCGVARRSNSALMVWFDTNWPTLTGSVLPRSLIVAVAQSATPVDITRRLKYPSLPNSLGSTTTPAPATRRATVTAKGTDETRHTPDGRRLTSPCRFAAANDSIAPLSPPQLQLTPDSTEPRSISLLHPAAANTFAPYTRERASPLAPQAATKSIATVHSFWRRIFSA
jgi:hypothetical protein